MTMQPLMVEIPQQQQPDNSIIPIELRQQRSLLSLQQEEEEEDFTEFSKEQWIWLIMLLLNQFLLRWVGQMDWDHSDKSHDIEHHRKHLVLLSETLALFICALFFSRTLFIITQQRRQEQGNNNSFNNSNKIIDISLALLLPTIAAVLYQLENYGMFVAYSHLPSWVFEVGYNSRLMIMAVVSMYCLRRNYSFQKWISLMGISLMCSIMQWEESVYYSNNDESNAEERKRTILWGMLALSWIVFCNVAASVILEWMLQKEKRYQRYYYRQVSEQQQQQVSPANAPATAPLLDDSSLKFWLCAVAYFATTFIFALVKTTMTPASTSGNEENNSGNSNREYSIYDTSNNTLFGSFFFYGFNRWTWLLILFRAMSNIAVLKVIQSTSCVMEFIVTRVGVVSASIIDIESSNITERSYLIVILIATFVEFCFVYSYGIPLSKWPYYKYNF